MGAPTIVLIGLRCAGKSSSGAALANALDGSFMDLDDAAARSLGCAHPGEAIEKHGIETFRNAEAESLRSALADPPRVLALGGGAPTAPGATELLADAQRSGLVKVFYLRAQVSTLRERMALSDSAHRPSLTGAGAVDEIGTLFAQRDGAYTDLAESIIETDGVPQESLVRALVALATTPA